jgi:hypothetical protein
MVGWSDGWMDRGSVPKVFQNVFSSAVCEQIDLKFGGDLYVDLFFSSSSSSSSASPLTSPSPPPLQNLIYT